MANSWYTIGHDERRTSASDGSISNLTEQWKYTVIPLPGNTNAWAGAGSIIADVNNVWYGYQTYNPLNSGSGDKSGVDKLTSSGSLVWSNQNLGINHTEHLWIAKIGNYIFYNEDVLGKLDDSNGVEATRAGYDVWGEICPKPDGTKFFTGNSIYMDNGPAWIGAVPIDFVSLPYFNYLWSKDPMNGQKISDVSNLLNLVFDNGTLFYAPHYVSSNSLGNYDAPECGVYAFTETGTQLWYVPTIVTYGMSAGNNLLYLVEYNQLVARNQSNGSISWQVTITGAPVKHQPPIVVGSLVIIASSSGVFAYDAITGVPVWNNPILNIPFSPYVDMDNTVMAAATGSNTLIVTANAGIYVLSLVDGSQSSFIIPALLSTGNRAGNPVIVGNKLYITDSTKGSTGSSPLRIICLADLAFTPPPDITPPTAPSALVFSGVSDTAITLSWTASTDASGISGYTVHFRVSGGTWNTVTTGATSYTFTGLSASTTYEFYVNSTDGAGNISSNSGTSSQATTAPPSPPPSVVLQGAITNKTTHSFIWTTNSVLTQELQRKTKSQTYATIYTGNSPYSYVQTSTTNSYTYRIKLGGGVAYSNEVSLKSTKR